MDKIKADAEAARPGTIVATEGMRIELCDACGTRSTRAFSLALARRTAPSSSFAFVSARFPSSRSMFCISRSVVRRRK